MTLFWDTSAVLALVLEEPHSRLARDAAAKATSNYAWRWMPVEATAGLARRGATAAQWERLARLLDAFRYVEIPSGRLDELCRLNREWRLRAADAGHLFSFRLTAYVLRDVALVCLDTDLCECAGQVGLAVWPATEPAKATPPAVREAASAYGGAPRRPRRPSRAT